MSSNPTRKDLEISLCLEKPLWTHYSLSAFGCYLQDSYFQNTFQLIMCCVSIKQAVSCWLYWKLQAQSRYMSPSYPSWTFKKKKGIAILGCVQGYISVYFSCHHTVNSIIKAEKWHTTGFPSLTSSWLKSVNSRWWQKCDKGCSMWTFLLAIQTMSSYSSLVSEVYSKWP